MMNVASGVQAEVLMRMTATRLNSIQPGLSTVNLSLSYLRHCCQHLLPLKHRVSCCSRSCQSQPHPPRSQARTPPLHPAT
jgi:hypothetical protein